MATLSAHESRFVARIPRLRAQRQMTCQELADRIARQGTRLSRVALARIETQKRRVTLGEAIAIAEALEVPLAEMYSPEPLVLRVETVVD